MKSKTISSKLLLRLGFAVVYAAGLLLVASLGWENRETLKLFLLQARWERIVWVFVAYLASLAIAGMGWVMVMRPLAPSLLALEHLEIYLFTLAARRLPGTLWYVGGRILLYEKKDVPRSQVIVGSGIEWILQLISGSIVGLTLLLLTRTMLSGLLTGIILIVLAGGLLLTRPKFIQRILRWRNPQAEAPLLKYSLIWICFGIYGLMWFFGGGIIAALVSIVQPITLHSFLYICGAFSLSGVAGLLVVFFPSSFGVSDITLAAFLTTMLPLPLAGAVAILLRFLTLALEFLLALICAPFLLQKYY